MTSSEQSESNGLIIKNYESSENLVFSKGEICSIYGASGTSQFLRAVGGLDDSLPLGFQRIYNGKAILSTESLSDLVFYASRDEIISTNLKEIRSNLKYFRDLSRSSITDLQIDKIMTSLNLNNHNDTGFKDVEASYMLAMALVLNKEITLLDDIIEHLEPEAIKLIESFTKDRIVLASHRAPIKSLFPGNVKTLIFQEGKIAHLNDYYSLNHAYKGTVVEVSFTESATISTKIAFSSVLRDTFEQKVELFHSSRLRLVAILEDLNLTNDLVNMLESVIRANKSNYSILRYSISNNSIETLVSKEIWVCLDSLSVQNTETQPENLTINDNESADNNLNSKLNISKPLTSKPNGITDIIWIKLKELSQSKFNFIVFNLLLMLPFVYLFFTILFNPHSDDPLSLLNKQQVYFASNNSNLDPFQYYAAIKDNLVHIKDPAYSNEGAFKSYFEKLFHEDNQLNCGLFFDGETNITTIYTTTHMNYQVALREVVYQSFYESKSVKPSKSQLLVSITNSDLEERYAYAIGSFIPFYVLIILLVNEAYNEKYSGRMQAILSTGISYKSYIHSNIIVIFIKTIPLMIVCCLTMLFYMYDSGPRILLIVLLIPFAVLPTIMLVWILRAVFKDNVAFSKYLICVIAYSLQGYDFMIRKIFFFKSLLTGNFIVTPLALTPISEYILAIFRITSNDPKMPSAGLIFLNSAVLIILITFIYNFALNYEINIYYFRSKSDENSEGYSLELNSHKSRHGPTPRSDYVNNKFGGFKGESISYVGTFKKKSTIFEYYSLKKVSEVTFINSVNIGDHLKYIEEYARSVTYISSDISMFFRNLSVSENLKFYFKGTSIDSKLNRFGLPKVQSRLIKELSKNELLKLKLAVAFCESKPIIMLENLSLMLDKEIKQIMLKETISTYESNPSTILMMTGQYFQEASLFTNIKVRVEQKSNFNNLEVLSEEILNGKENHNAIIFAIYPQDEVETIKMPPLIHPSKNLNTKFFTDLFESTTTLDAKLYERHFGINGVIKINSEGSNLVEFVRVMNANQKIISHYQIIVDSKQD